jgi:hypothetical protein
VSAESNEQREQLAADVEGRRERRALKVRRRDRLFRLETRALYAVAIGLAIWVFNLAGDIKDERIHNSTVACERDSAKNAAIRSFVANSIAANPEQRAKLRNPRDPLRSRPYSSDPEMNAYLMRAVQTFPVVSHKKCAERARQQIKAG